MSNITMHPIGHVRSSRSQVQDDLWDREQCHIELDGSAFSPDALAGVELFSHVEVLFLLDGVDPQAVETGSRHPRGNPDWPKVGIFAQRGKNRPNRIGATVCRVVKVQGTQLHLAGLDAIDGTPVLDVKPWVAEFGPRGEIFQPAWITELMKCYWSDD